MKTSHKPLLIFVAAILTTSTAGLAQGARPAFSVTISAQEKVKFGSMVELNIVVKNVADHPIVFGSDGLMHNETNFTFYVRDSAGKIPSDTPYMKGPGPDFGNLTYSKLKPGETLKLSIDLCKMFELVPGKYTVQLSRFENAFAVYGSTKREDADSGSKRKDQSGPPVLYEPSPNSNLEVKSNTVTVTVVP